MVYLTLCLVSIFFPFSVASLKSCSGSWVTGVACFCFRQRLRSELTEHLTVMKSFSEGIASSTLLLLFPPRVQKWYLLSELHFHTEQERKISDPALCYVDEGPIQQRWRKGAVNHHLFSAVQRSFMCTWTSIPKIGMHLSMPKGTFL